MKLPIFYRDDNGSGIRYCQYWRNFKKHVVDSTGSTNVSGYRQILGNEYGAKFLTELDKNFYISFDNEEMATLFLFKFS